MRIENGADLYVNDRQKMRHYHVRSAEERMRRKKKKKNAKSLLFTSRSASLLKIAQYSDFIHSFNWKSAMEHDGGV